MHPNDFEAAMYSASVDENETDVCFLFDQLIAPVPILRKYPVVDHHASKHPAWSASLYALKISVDSVSFPSEDGQ